MPYETHSFITNYAKNFRISSTEVWIKYFSIVCNLRDLSDYGKKLALNSMSDLEIQLDPRFFTSFYYHDMLNGRIEDLLILKAEIENKITIQNSSNEERIKTLKYISVTSLLEVCLKFIDNNLNLIDLKNVNLSLQNSNFDSVYLVINHLIDDLLSFEDGTIIPIEDEKFFLLLVNYSFLKKKEAYSKLITLYLNNAEKDSSFVDTSHILNMFDHLGNLQNEKNNNELFLRLLTFLLNYLYTNKSSFPERLMLKLFNYQTLDIIYNATRNKLLRGKVTNNVKSLLIDFENIMFLQERVKVQQILDLVSIDNYNI